MEMPLPYGLEGFSKPDIRFSSSHNNVCVVSGTIRTYSCYIERIATVLYHKYILKIRDNQTFEITWLEPDFFIGEEAFSDSGKNWQIFEWSVPAWRISQNRIIISVGKPPEINAKKDDIKFFFSFFFSFLQNLVCFFHITNAAYAIPEICKRFGKKRFPKWKNSG